MSRGFAFEQFVVLFEQTHSGLHRRAARSVDLALVARNWLFGWYIVEYEQNGTDRAEYGSQLLANLSERLQRMGLKGSSQTRLKLYRAFYQQYKRIGPTASDELAALPSSGGSPEIRPTVSDVSVLFSSDGAEDKWFASIQAAIEGEVQRLTQRLAGRVKELEERYARPLPELEQDVGALSTKVEYHLKKMGLVFNG